MSESTGPHPSTSCARPPLKNSSQTPPLAPPLYLSTVYEFSGLDQVDAIYQGRETGFIYARDGHPNARQFAEKMAVLEGGEQALICASGMAAESAVMLALLSQGDRVAMAEGLYGRTSLLVSRELARFGIGHDLFDQARPETLESVFTDRTRLVFVETLTNPLLRMADIEGLVRITRSRGVAPGCGPHLCPPALPTPEAGGRPGGSLRHEIDRRP